VSWQVGLGRLPSVLIVFEISNADTVFIGSIAATAQAGIGNVAGGTLFATATSAGMGGAGLSVVAAAAQGGFGVLAAGSAAVARKLAKGNKSEGKVRNASDGKVETVWGEDWEP